QACSLLHWSQGHTHTHRHTHTHTHTHTDTPLNRWTVQSAVLLSLQGTQLTLRALGQISVGISEFIWPTSILMIRRAEHCVCVCVCACVCVCVCVCVRVCVMFIITYA